jgi:nucleoid-associated protein YgaU
MQIGFKFYSDYRKWKDIYQWNKKTLGGSPDIEGKPLLTLRGPFRRYQAPLGSPYLIKPGDNLGEISMKVYGTSKKWQSIWHLNKRQIRYPDLIFSGFTLYYDTEQELAAGH